MQTVGNSCRRATALGPTAVVETEVDELNERVDPRQHADAAKLSDQQRLREVRRSQRVKDVHGESQQETQREKNGPDARQPLRREPTLLRDYVGCGTETRDWWNHDSAGKMSALAAALVNCLASNIRRDHTSAEDR